MLAHAFLLIAGFAQTPVAVPTPTQQQLAERFVDAATPKKMPAMDSGADFMAEALIRANPSRQAEARRIADLGDKCISSSRDGRAAMRQAAVEAALRFSNEQLEHLISFLKMRDAQRREGVSNRIPLEWETARRDYGRWMYGIASQPSAVALVKRCSNETAARMAAAGLRD